MEKSSKSAAVSYPLWKYEVFSSLQPATQDIPQQYLSFGIQVILNGSCPALVIDSIEDVSVTRREVEKIAARLNRYQLSPLHLYEALLDMLE
ncbi:MAG: DUF6514 family protein [Oscillospiraceae bacterium]|nr:DUF6514 family protein [Oscillospiraceae bacterium]